MKKYKIKNATPYGVVGNKNKTKGVVFLSIPDDHMPLERNDIKIEIIPSKHALQERGLLPNDQK